jgi:hypothetical protein
MQEVSNPAIVSTPNRFLGNVMTARLDPATNPGTRNLDAWQPKEHEVEPEPVLNQLLDPGSERSRRQRRFEREASPGFCQLSEATQHEPPSRDGSLSRIEPCEALRDDVSIHELANGQRVVRELRSRR